MNPLEESPGFGRPILMGALAATALLIGVAATRPDPPEKRDQRATGTATTSGDLGNGSGDGNSGSSGSSTSSGPSGTGGSSTANHDGSPASPTSEDPGPQGGSSGSTGAPGGADFRTQTSGGSTPATYTAEEQERDRASAQAAMLRRADLADLGTWSAVDPAAARSRGTAVIAPGRAALTTGCGEAAQDDPLDGVTVESDLWESPDGSALGTFTMVFDGASGARQTFSRLTNDEHLDCVADELAGTVEAGGVPVRRIRVSDVSDGIVGADRDAERRITFLSPPGGEQVELLFAVVRVGRAVSVVAMADDERISQIPLEEIAQAQVDRLQGAEASDGP